MHWCGCVANAKLRAACKDAISICQFSLFLHRYACFCVVRSYLFRAFVCWLAAPFGNWIVCLFLFVRVFVGIFVQSVCCLFRVLVYCWDCVGCFSCDV